MVDALRMKRLDKQIKVRQIFYSKWSEVMEAIMQEEPDVLWMGCHATERGLELYRTIVTSEMIRQGGLERACACNQQAAYSGGLHQRLRSIALALEFAKFIDFVIGHLGEVEDAYVQFASLFTQYILDLCTLLRAFRWRAALPTGTACTQRRTRRRWCSWARGTATRSSSPASSSSSEQASRDDCREV